MGCDASNTFPKGVKKDDVAEFLTLLGYMRQNPSYYVFYKDEDYKYFEGVGATIYSEDGVLTVHTHTRIWRSKADSEFHNFTIKQLYKRFGGSFHSDSGKGRYLRYNGIERFGAEAGCYNAYFRFEDNIGTASLYLMNRATKYEMPEPEPKNIRAFPWLGAVNPVIISNNFVVPFIVANIEDYFKKTYIVLLKYSPKKLSILKNARILTEDLLAISTGDFTIEEAVARTMSFQNIAKVNGYFKEVDNKLDIAGTLRKPYRRRKESLYDALDRILNQRHAFIHQNIIMADYLTQHLERDLDSVKVAIDRVYKTLIKHYGWQSE